MTNKREGPTRYREFNTLRGFLAGQEPDEEPPFAYSATLRIGGENLDFGEITRELRVTPTYTHRKGDRSNIDHAGIEVPYTCLQMFDRLQIPFGISIIIA